MVILMRMTFKGYILVDEDGMLVVQHGKTRRIGTMIETSHYNMPMMFTRRSNAKKSLEQNQKMNLTPSANTYCKKYNITNIDPLQLLHIQPCSITIEY